MTMKLTVLVSTVGLLLAAPALAQTDVSPTVVAEPSATQLAAATRLMDVMMPPAQREAMTLAMVDAMLQNMATGVLNSDPIKTALEGRPEARPLFERFMERQRGLAQQSMRRNLPSMIDAMAIAYARRFTAVELAEMEAFFATPTGQAYVVQSGQILSDPAVAGWQQRVMAEDIERIPAELSRFRAELRELIEKESGQ
jgi:hypothetical protein